MNEARCKGCDPNLFFTERGHNRENKRALDICVPCDVKHFCLDYAIANKEKFGVFGGKSDRGRRKWRLHLRATQTEFAADIYPAVDDIACEMTTDLRMVS